VWSLATLDLYTASIPRSRSWTTLQVFQEADRDQELVGLSDSGTGYPAPVPEEFPHHTGYSLPAVTVSRHQAHIPTTVMFLHLLRLIVWR
jgi:hypothetical protein